MELIRWRFHPRTFERVTNSLVPPRKRDQPSLRTKERETRCKFLPLYTLAIIDWGEKFLSLSLSSCEKKWRIICISNGNIETHFPDITFYPSSNYYIYIYIDETDSFDVIPSMLITIISHLFRPGYIQEGIVKSGGSFNRAERELVYRVDNNRFSFPFFFLFIKHNLSKLP